MKTYPALFRAISSTDYDSFRKNGYLVLPDALSPADLAEFLATFDRDFKEFNYLWRPFGNHQVINCDSLVSSPAIDRAVRHPRILPVIQDLMGGPVCFSEICLRHMPPFGGKPSQGWHRDKPHNLEHPLRMDYIQLMIYLTDVDERSHCFSISPESVDEPILASHQEQLVRSPAVDIHAKAGTAVLFNISVLHTATCRTTDVQRKTIQVYYGHQARPALSNDSLIPPTLWRSNPDPETRAFYGNLNDKTRMYVKGFEG